MNTKPLPRYLLSAALLVSPGAIVPVLSATGATDAKDATNGGNDNKAPVTTQVVVKKDETSAAAKIPSSGNTIKPGDSVKFLVDVPGFHPLKASGEPDLATFVCVPARSRFAVHRIETTTTSTTGPAEEKKEGAGEGANGKSAPDHAGVSVKSGAGPAIESKVETTTLVFGAFSSGPFQLKGRMSAIDPDAKCAGKSEDTKAGTEAVQVKVKGTESDPLPARPDTGYVVSSETLQNFSSYRAGFAWGTLIVPYKFEFHDHTFASVPSTLAYVGWQGWFPGISLTGVLSAGPGIATGSTQKKDDSDSSTGSKVTYTAATGMVATFGESFKAGLMFGADWEGHHSDFKYEGKPWLALSIGTGFE